MTDKEKLDAIRAEIRRLVDVRGYSKGMANDLFTFMDSLPSEPVNKDFELALAEMVDKAQKCVVEPWVVAAQWKDELIKLAKSEEPVSEELEEAANAYISNENNYSHSRTDTFKAGAKWQKEKDFQYIKKECERVGFCCDEDIAIEAQRRHPYYYTSDIEAYANIGFKEGAMWQKQQDQKK